jgi:protein-disulfide isomerase
LILVVAIALYVFADKLLAKAGGKKPLPGAPYIKSGVNIVAVILIVIGVNRFGFGTSHYLVSSNPAILQEMVENMQVQERERSARLVRSYIRNNAAEMMRFAPVIGNVDADASKTIYLWTSADCPHCRRVSAEISRVLAERDDVRVVIKNFPISGQRSDIPARWMIAAKIQDNAKAVALYRKIMTEQYWGDNPQAANLAKVITDNLRKYARAIGLDIERLEKDVTGPIVAQELMQVRELAQRFQINGALYLIIGDQVFPGAIPYHQIMNALR